MRETLERLPVKLNVFRMMAQAETCFRPLLQLGTAILARQALSPRLRELTILLVGRRSPAPYEWTQHVPIAKATGASDEQIAAVERGCARRGLLRRPGARGARRRGRAARAAAARRCRRSPRSSALFSPREIVELILTVGYYMMVARLLESTAVDIDPPAGTAVVDSLR